MPIQRHYGRKANLANPSLLVFGRVSGVVYDSRGAVRRKVAVIFLVPGCDRHQR
jgi:hypothetical protein